MSAAHDPVSRLKLQAGMLRQRATHASKHLGRERAKYRFDLVVQSAENLPDVRSATASVLVSCARGPKLACTTEAEEAESKASWNEKLSFVCTLYDAKQPERRWCEKRYRLSLQLAAPSEFGTRKKALREIAFTQLDVAQFAQAGAGAQRELTLRLGWSGKPLCYAMLRVLLSCELVRTDGGASHSASDARSISSELTDRSEGEGAHHALERTDEGEGVRRAAAARNAKMAPLASIRESLASRLGGARRGAGTAGPGDAAAARRRDGGSGQAAGVESASYGGADGVSRGGEHGERGGEEEARALGAGAHDQGWAEGAPAQRAASALEQRAAVHNDLSGPASAGAGARAPLPPAPAIAALPSELAGASAALPSELADARAEAELLRCEHAAATDGLRRREAEAERLREQVRTLALALHESTAANDEARAARAVHSGGEGGDGRGEGAADGGGGGAIAAQLRVNEELRAALAEAEAGRAELARELERSEHVASKLRLALSAAQSRRDAAQREAESAQGELARAEGGAPLEADAELEVTELQLALVDAKMQLATIEYEREEVRRTQPARSPCRAARAARARARQARVARACCPTPAVR